MSSQFKKNGKKRNVVIEDCSSRLQANLGTLHYADYKANTPAWQNRNKLDKHGKPLYKIGDDVWRKI